MLQFAYQDEALGGRPPPSLPASATVRWRPLVPVTCRRCDVDCKVEETGPCSGRYVDGMPM